jgi:hypothetical protein
LECIENRLARPSFAKLAMKIARLFRRRQEDDEPVYLGDKKVDVMQRKRRVLVFLSKKLTTNDKKRNCFRHGTSRGNEHDQSKASGRRRKQPNYEAN